MALAVNTKAVKGRVSEKPSSRKLAEEEADNEAGLRPGPTYASRPIAEGRDPVAERWAKCKAEREAEREQERTEQGSRSSVSPKTQDLLALLLYVVA